MVSTNRIGLFVLWALALLAVMPAIASAQVITGVTIEDNSTYFGPRPPVSSINGSGGVSTSSFTGNNNWSNYSDSFLADYSGPGSAYIVFNLNATYNVDKFHVWNYYDVDAARSAKDVQITYSTTNPLTGATLSGTGYTTLSPFTTLNQANLSNPGGDIYTFASPITANYIRFDFESNYGSGSHVGLSEIRFNNYTGPPPALTWNGGSGSPKDGPGDWTTGTPWWTGTASSAWTDGVAATFGAGAGTAGTVAISGTVQPASITFNPTGGGNYTISGGTIDLGGQPVTITANVGATIDSTITNGGLTKTGTAALVLLGSNNYGGLTTISGGTLQIGNNTTAGSISPGSVIQNNGTLVFNRSDPLAQGTDFAGGISGSGSVTQAGSGMLVLNGVNSYNGGTTVNGGTLSLGDGGATGIIRGPLTISSGATVDASNKWAMGYATGVTSIAVNGGTLNFHGNAGDGGISAKNITMTGGTISGVRMDWFNNGGLPQFTLTTNASSVSSVVSNDLWLRMEAAGGNVTFDVAHGSAGDDLLISGNILTDGGTAGITKTGAGKMVLSGDNNTYTGDTTIAGGTLSITHPYLAHTADVRFTGSSFFNLDFLTPGATDDIRSLYIDDVQQLGGTWGAPGSGADHQNSHFSGSGLLNVLVGAVVTSGNFWVPGSTTPTWTSGMTSGWSNTEGGTSTGGQATSGTLVFATTGETVTVGDAVTATGMQFKVDGYTLASGGTGTKITLGSSEADKTITTDPDVTATISAEITGSDGMIKYGLGTLVLSADSNSYGATDVQQGTLQINTAGALPAGQALTIEAGATVVLASGLSAAGAGAGSAVSANAVPEPGTIALLAAGLLGLAVTAWRKRK